VFPLPSTPPAEEPTYEVFVRGIGDQEDGLYAVTDLATLEEMPGQLRIRRPPSLPLGDKTAAELLARARVALLGHDVQLDSDARRILDEQFGSFVMYQDLSVFVRR
jgi:hypothetical protein